MRSICRKPQPKRKFWKSRGKPRLFRFSWEQRKLEDYLSVSNEKNTSDVYGRADVLSVSGDFGIVNQIEFQGRSFAGASVSNYGVVQTGDVVYTKSPLNSNPYGIIKTNKGKAGIVSTLYAVYHPRETVFPDFVQVYFEQHARMNNYMHPLVNKGAKNDMKVSAENALKGPVCFPSYAEQRTISAFFSVLDNLITLHQRTASSIAIKNVGETHPWEQRKCKELCSITTGKSNKQDQVEDGLYPFYIRSDMPVRSNKYLYDCEAVITIGDGQIGKVFHYVNGKFDLHQRCYKMADFVWIFGKYFFYYFSTKFYDRAIKMTAKATVDSVRMDMISEMDIQYPISSQEQHQIALILERLDNLITLHQRERKNRLFGGKNVKQYNFSRPVLQLLCAMDSRLQRRGSPQGDYG